VNFALRSVQDGLLIADTSGLITFANRSAGAILGVPARGLVGQNLTQRLPGPLDADTLARLVAERGSAEAVKALAPIVAAMDAAAGTRRFEEWADLNTRFHQAISAATGLPLLQEMTERMLGRWDRIRRHYFKGVLRHRVLEAQREHRNILSALEDRDLPRLQSEVQHHNRCALAAYLRYVDTHTGRPAATSASARS